MAVNVVHAALASFIWACSFWNPLPTTAQKVYFGGKLVPQYPSPRSLPKTTRHYFADFKYAINQPVNQSVSQSVNQAPRFRNDDRHT